MTVWELIEISKDHDLKGFTIYRKAQLYQYSKEILTP